MITVNSFGLHWMEGDIAFLVQQGQIDHVLDVDLTIDVQVMLPKRKLQCPHNVRLEIASDLSLPPHPLVWAFCPLPKPLNDRIVVIEETEKNRLLVNQLLRLSSPSGSLSIQPIWMYTPAFISAQLTLTNIQPLVLTGHTVHHQPAFEKIAASSLYMPRRLVIMAPKWAASRMANTAFCETDTLSVKELEVLPLEAIGAHILRQRMLLPKTPN